MLEESAMNHNHIISIEKGIANDGYWKKTSKHTDNNNNKKPKTKQKTPPPKSVPSLGCFFCTLILFFSKLCSKATMGFYWILLDSYIMYGLK